MNVKYSYFCFLFYPSKCSPKLTNFPSSFAGINPEDARTFEERSMLEDAKYWLASGCLGDVPNPKTGASALHVAAAKGYIKVMK